MMNDKVPVFKMNELSKFYPNQEKRIENLISKFTTHFNQKPLFFTRSPGRVNLIGEHVDYSDFSVLPMAVSKDSLMAVWAQESDSPTIELANIDSKYDPTSFRHEDGVHVTIDSSIHAWSNYFKCGYKGLLDVVDCKPVSIKVMVDGNVPAGSGLSSSSAFVCCAALTTMHCHGLNLSKGELAQAAINGESLAGVQIGGMDQSISIMGVLNSALLIDFYPRLNASLVKLPTVKPAPVFVIANSLVTSNKHVTAPFQFNLRVVETRFASALLAKKLGLGNGFTNFKKVQQGYLGSSCELKAFDEMLSMVDKYFKKDPYTLDEIASELELSLNDLYSIFVKNIVVKADSYHLYARAKHVYSEAQRVYKFQHFCSENPPDILEKLGSLMNESHYSCRDLYDCSCKELNDLTLICRQQGAKGSRLTGAGWGGCTVSLVTEDKVEEFIESVKEKYYRKFVDANPGLVLDDCIFATQPGQGAAIITLQ